MRCCSLFSVYVFNSWFIRHNDKGLHYISMRIISTKTMVYCFSRFVSCPSFINSMMRQFSSLWFMIQCSWMTMTWSLPYLIDTLSKFYVGSIVHHSQGWHGDVIKQLQQMIPCFKLYKMSNTRYDVSSLSYKMIQT